MRTHSKTAFVTGLCFTAGLLGMLLRQWFLTTSQDAAGLLITNHLGNILVWVLTLIIFAPIVQYCCLPHSKDRVSQPAISGAVSIGALCLSILSTTPFLFRGVNHLHTITGVAAILAGLCCIYIAALRLKNLRTHFWAHCIIVVFMMLLPVYQYQQWSTVAQFERYCFQLLASVCLMLSAYHRAALDCSSGNYRMYLFFSLSALYFCLTAIAGSSLSLFYLAAALWVGIDCWTLAPGLKSGIANTIDLPVYAEVCIDMLENAGFPTYAVGGCVRDSLLGLTPQDYDLCTAATPEEIQQVFKDHRLVLTGEKHGTVSVMISGKPVEITTFRKEGGYTDNRHPNWVQFVSSVEEDLSRRDFTINAMAYSPYRGFADPFCGRDDLKSGILRAVGDPAKRFEEDALRILRGMRFSVRYNLQPEENTFRAMTELVPLMDNLARERVFEELCKILPLVSAEDLLRFAPILCQAVPVLAPTFHFDQHSPHHAYDLFTHTAHVTGAVSKELPLRLAALLHDIGKVPTFYQDEDGRGHFPHHAQTSAEMADALLLQLKAPTLLRNQVVELIDKHMLLLEPDKKFLRRWVGKLGWQTFDQLLSLQEADMSSKGVDAAEELQQFAEIRHLLQEIQEENACLSIKDLAINGRDLLDLGYAAGPKIGACLQDLLASVQEEILPNEKTVLLHAATVFMDKEETP